MSSLDEKRVYDPDTDPETAIVASETGVASVSLAGGRVGSVSLRYRDPATDVATRGERVAVATGVGVFELAGENARDLGGPRPANAVAIDDQGRTLAGGEGALSRRVDGEWHRLGSVVEIRAIDGDLVASSEGVFRIVGDELRYSGLNDVFDVASAGIPHAASSTGLYALANGWIGVLEGSVSVVAADPETANPGSPGRAHAVGTDHAYEHTEDGWQRRAFPTEEAVVDVAYGETAYAVTENGTFLVDDGEDWRTHPLGLRGVRSLAIVSR